MADPSEVTRHYHRMQISTSGPSRLICLLHEKTTFFLRKAGIDNQKVDIDKAQNLIAALDMSVTGRDNTSSLLHSIYKYCYDLLENPTTLKIENASKLMQMLEETFRKLSGNPRPVNKQQTNSG